MLEPKNPSADPVIDAVVRLNSRYNNTNYSKRNPVHVGSGNLYTVVFKGEDGYWRENYVYERGSKVIAYLDLREMILDRGNGLIPSLRDPEFIKLMVISILTFMFAIAVTYLVIHTPDNKSLQVLTGLLGLTIGYLVGNVQTQK